MIHNLHTITTQQMTAIRQAVDMWPGSWRVSQHVDYDGFASLIIVNMDLAGEPGWFVSGRSDRIELSRMDSSDMRPVGAFETVLAAIEELCRRVR